MKDTDRQRSSHKFGSESLRVLEGQSHAQVRKNVLPICTHACDHTLRSYSMIIIATLTILITLTDTTQRICGEILNKYPR